MLANILLDDFDKELERRGLRFGGTRTTSSSWCGADGRREDVKASVTRWLTRRLKLVVNEQKSQVAPVHQCRFLGFTFAGCGFRRDSGKHANDQVVLEG